jgi:acyl transferase domain-containing protein/phosphopantetheinyl transferase (holo-ACP synthase)
MISGEGLGHSDEEGVRGDVAIIGMACVLPGAPDLETFWHNIVSKVDAITDVPPERWDPAIFFDPDSFANDRVYSKRGGYLTYPVQFNPADVGVIPIAVIHGEPEQFLALMVAHHALADAGYLDRPTDRERTQVIMGRGNYLNRGILTMMQHVRGAEDALRIIQRFRPDLTEAELRAIKEELKASLPMFNADTAPTLIPNLTTGRIANRLNLMGTNFTVDAACASSLIATEIGARDLLTRKCDLVLVGGIYVSTDVGFQAIFCQLHALSHRSQIRPFDKDADGLLLGEGAGCLVLKRLEDAERDGDRVYAVIKGVGSSSDGRALGVLAPRVEGEELALQRAYAMAGIPPQTVQLIEAHGTATIAGDLAEVQAMTRVFGRRDEGLPWCALGSIKSMIGHLMPAAGIAGLIKATLALYHKTLPPTLNCQTPNPRLELQKTPFYVNTETRPWIHAVDQTPRRAGVNAFGFGGINAHVILEEHGHHQVVDTPSHLLSWETEVCIVQGHTRQALSDQLEHLLQYLQEAPRISLKDLAYTLNCELKQAYRVAIVASSVDNLGSKIERTLERLSDPQRQQIKDRDGIYFFEQPLSQEGKLAFLFPGVGAAYPDMLADLCLHFPEVRSCFDLADQLFTPRRHPSLLPSQIIYPPPEPSAQERSQVQQRLWQEDGVLEAIHAADGALFALLRRLGVHPDMVVGHSFGDFFSLLLAASPDASREVLIEAMVALEHSVHGTIRAYERLRAEGQIPEDIALLNVGTDSATVANLFAAINGRLYISMDNCPHQVVVAGERGAVAQLTALLKAKGVFYEELPIHQPAYHTPMFEGARGLLEDQQWTPPTHLVEVYSCTTASPYPRNPAAIRQLSVEHWMRRVDFRRTVDAMYEAGARIFVEVGPGGILTAFVDDILRGRPYLAVAANVPRRSGITQLNHLVGMLASQRVPISLEYLYQRRAPRRLSLDAVVDGATNGHNAPGMVDLALLGTPSLKLSSQFSAGKDAALALPLDHDQFTAPPPAPLEGRPKADQYPRSNGTQGHPEAAQSPIHSSQQLAESQPPTPAPAGLAMGAPRPPRVLREAMQNYLQTMNTFLETQADVMHSLMAGARDGAPPRQQPIQHADRPGQSIHTEAPLSPFVGQIISVDPSQEVITRRQITLSEDLLLHDHTFGGQVSAVDATLEPLPVIPMTMGMEIMAETAALLMPGKPLIGMKDIQTYQWIDLEEEQTLLQISARRRAVDQPEIEVRVYNLGKIGEENAGKGVLVLQGTMVFGDAYPEPPQVQPPILTSPRRPEFSAAEMYQEGLMFHGPRFQGVATLDAIAEEGVVGQLRTLPIDTLFRSIDQPHLLTDFALLDAAGQLVGYWPLEWVKTGYVMFPIRLDELRIYGPPLPPGHTVVCQVHMRDVHHKYMRADITILGLDGRLWMRLEGWCDWRFYCPDEAYDFSRFPGKIVASKPMADVVARFPSPERFHCCVAEHSEALYSKDALAFWIKMWARLICSRQERQAFYRLGGLELQQIERLLARVAAKDAVRSLFHRLHGVTVHPADIDMGMDDSGQPEPHGYWQQEIGYTPAVAVANFGQLAIAIAGRCASQERLAVDLQPIASRTPEFEPGAFSPEEEQLLDGLEAPARREWLTRFWSAKHVIGKALGCGLRHGPQSVRITAFEADGEAVKAVLGDQLADEFTALADVAMTVYTIRFQDYVIASTLCEGV